MATLFQSRRNRGRSRIRWKFHYQRRIEGAVSPDIHLAEVLGGDNSDESVRSNIGPSGSSYSPKRAHFRPRRQRALCG